MYGNSDSVDFLNSKWSAIILKSVVVLGLILFISEVIIIYNLRLEHQSQFLLTTHLTFTVGLISSCFLLMKPRLLELLQLLEELHQQIKHLTPTAKHYLKRSDIFHKSLRIGFIYMTFTNIILHFKLGHKSSALVWYVQIKYPSMCWLAFSYHLIWSEVGLVTYFAVTKISSYLIMTFIFPVNFVADYIYNNDVLNINKYYLTEVEKEEYQRKIFEELRIIYDRHLLLCSYIGLLSDGHTTRYIGGSLMVVGLSTVPFLFKFVNTFEKLSGITFLLPMGLSILMMAFEIFNAGQGIEDQFGEIYTALVNVPWYWWNKQNKKSYMIIISMLQEVKSLYSGLNSKVNRKGFLRYTRIVYGTSNFFYHVHQQK